VPSSLRQLQKRGANPAQTLLAVQDAVRREILTRMTFAIKQIVRVCCSSLPPPCAILKHASGGFENVPAQVRYVTKPASTRQSYKDVLHEVFGLGTVSDTSDKIPLKRSPKALYVSELWSATRRRCI
jgi:hypothetical protein